MESKKSELTANCQRCANKNKFLNKKTQKIIADIEQGKNLVVADDMEDLFRKLASHV